MVLSQPQLDVDRFRGKRETEVFVNRLNGALRGLGTVGNPEELWNAFKTTNLDVASGYLGTPPSGKEKCSLPRDTGYY